MYVYVRECKFDVLVDDCYIYSELINWLLVYLPLCVIRDCPEIRVWPASTHDQDSRRGGT